MKESEFFRQPTLVLLFLNSTIRDMTTSKLAKEFKVYSGNMAKVIKKLEKMELVKKQKSNNKRELYVVLTNKGKKLSNNIQKIQEKVD